MDFRLKPYTYGRSRLPTTDLGGLRCHGALEHYNACGYVCVSVCYVRCNKMHDVCRIMYYVACHVACLMVHVLCFMLYACCTMYYVLCILCYVARIVYCALCTCACVDVFLSDCMHVCMYVCMHVYTAFLPSPQSC